MQAAASAEALRALLRDLYAPLPPRNGGPEGKGRGGEGGGAGGGPGEELDAGRGVLVAGIALPLPAVDVEGLLGDGDGEAEGKGAVEGERVRVWVTVCGWEEAEEMVLVVPHASVRQMSPDTAKRARERECLFNALLP